LTNTVVEVSLMQWPKSTRHLKHTVSIFLSNYHFLVPESFVLHGLNWETVILGNSFGTRMCYTPVSRVPSNQPYQ